MTSVRPPQIAQRLVDAYITGLRQRLPTLCIRRLDQLPGASEQQLLKLRQVYPAAPAELLYMLQRVNGTYWEAVKPSTSARGDDGGSTAGAPAAAAPTGGGAKPSGAKAAAASFVKSALSGPQRKPVSREKIAVPILGSALAACPYFLTTVEDIVAPFQQRFPPPRKSAPRQPTTEDPSAPAAESRTGGEAAASASATQNPSRPVGEVQRDARHPGRTNIETLYANMNIIRGLPPGDEETGTVISHPPPGTAAAGVTADPTSSLASAQSFDRSRKSVYVDPRISTQANFGQWLAFADSMLPHHQPWELDEDETAEAPKQQQGATATSSKAAAAPPRKASVSRLYIDFAPETAAGGVPGQIIQYSRGEPESFRVIAPDFGEYLKFLMSEEYDFTEELEDDDDDDDDDDNADRGSTQKDSEGLLKTSSAGGQGGDIHVGPQVSHGAEGAASVDGSGNSTLTHPPPPSPPKK